MWPKQSTKTQIRIVIMFDISKQLPNYFTYNGKKYKLNLAFDNIINMFDLFKTDILVSGEITQFVLEMLIVNPIGVKSDAIDMIFNDYINIAKKSNDNSMRVLDYKQDSMYIYSSFMADYGIDLFEQQGKLHWWKFVSLLSGLSEKSKMREIMSIRSRPLPEPNKYNQKEIANLIELKQYYALDISQDERERNFKQGIARLAENLKQKAGG